MSISYLILAITSRCNLHCKYCYMDANRNGLDMADEIIDKAISISLIGEYPKKCHIQITGGEPTLVPAKIARGLLTPCSSSFCAFPTPESHRCENIVGPTGGFHQFAHVNAIS